MSVHDDDEEAIERIGATLKYTVEKAKDSLAEMSNLSDAFDDIDMAFDQVIDVLDRFNSRLAKLENAAAEKGATP